MDEELDSLEKDFNEAREMESEDLEQTEDDFQESLTKEQFFLLCQS